MTDIATLYHEQLLEAAQDTRFQGALNDPDVYKAGTNASCGDRVAVSIRLSDGKQHIAELKWEGAGCIISQASLSSLAEALQQQPVSSILAMTEESMLALLGLETISPARTKCMMLGLRTIQEALNEFRQHD